MKRIFFFSQFCRESQDYFSNYKDDIAKNNLILLRQAWLIYTLLLCLYSIIAAFLFRDIKLNLIYIIFLALAFLTMLPVRYISEKREISFRVIQILCAVFVCMVMSFVIVISVLPYPDRPGIFFPIVYLLLTAVFIFPIWKIHVCMTTVLVAYLGLCYFYKTPQCLSYDVFGSVTAWLVGFLFSFMILDLRLREHKVRCKLERISMIDELTHLPNRRAFDRYIEQVSLAARDRAFPYAVLMIDVDKFKDFNDRYGHIAGDQCLKSLASVLRNKMKGQKGTAFRFGGEEFVCIVENSERNGALKIAENILRQASLRSIDSGESRGSTITVSIGVALWQPHMEETGISVIQMADIALYSAKAQGRNRVVCYEREMAPREMQKGGADE